MTRTRSIAVTLWKNYPMMEVTEDVLHEYGVKYMHIGGLEKSTQNQELHYHAYVWFKHAKAFNIKKIKELFGQEQAHVEKLRSTAKKYIAYCDKERTKVNGTDPLFVWGTPPTMGRRTDLLTLRDHYKDGGTTKQALCINEIQPCLARHMKYAQACKLHFTPDRQQQTRLIWIYGPPRTGKTHRSEMIAEHLAEDYHAQSDKMESWWDGYEQQEVVIIEEFRGNIPLNHFLDLFDSSKKARVPIKGSSEKFTSKYIIVNSNLHWRDVWDSSKRHYRTNMAAFEKRMADFGITEQMHEIYDSPKHRLKKEKIQAELKEILKIGERPVLPLTSVQQTSVQLEKNVFSIEKPKLKRCPARTFDLKTKKLVIKDGGIIIADVLDDTDRCQSEETHQSNSLNSDGPTSLHSIPVPTRTQVEQSLCHPAETPSPCK